MEDVGGLAFGFPCNDFSQVGEQKGTDGYFGKLYKEAARALDEVRPDWFIAENVPGILQNGDGRSIMRVFANAGPSYRVAVHLYRFEEYGVPQRRHRVVGVGIREDLNLSYRPPVATHREPVSSKQALDGVEAVPDNNEHTRHPVQTIERLRHIPEGQNVWHPNVPEQYRINTRTQLSMIYRRLHRDEPAYTVTGSGGGGTHMYHWEEPRALTNRERARLQTFPDHFVFEGSKEEVRRQIGMAVPPLAARRIGEALLATLRGETYDAVEPSEGVVESGHTEQQLELQRL